MANALDTGALPIYARLLADSCGVQLEIGGAVAKTNGETIYLPSLPMNDATAKALAFGCIMHEAGHIRETTFQVWPDKQEALRCHLLNILEDCRMEACQIRHYAGGRQRLAAMATALVETGYFGAPQPTASACELMSAFMLYSLRASVLGQSALADFAQQAETYCRDALPASTVVRLKVLMQQVTGCRNTADALVLADEIIQMMEEEKDKQEDQSDASNEAGSDQSEGDDAASPPLSGAGQASAESGDAGDGDPDAGDCGSRTGPEQLKRENLANILSGQDSAGIGDIGDLLKQAVTDIAKRSTSADTVTPSSPVATASPVGFEHLLGEVRDQSRALRRRLANHMEALRQTSVRVGRTGNRLAKNRLYRVATLDPRIFERRSEAIEVNTAVMILIDRSGSMRDQLAAASKVALGLHDALDAIQGLSVAVSAFPGPLGEPDAVSLLADFDQPARSRVGAYGTMQIAGYTPMAQAMLYAGIELCRRKEPRKLLFVCTDGNPDYLDQAHEVIRTLEIEGIELMGLGIGIDVQHLFQNSATIDSIDQMSAAVFGLMQTKLLQAAA